MTAKHPMIPFPVIVRAADGDIEAIKMYREMQSSGGSDEVVIVDDVE